MKLLTPLVMELILVGNFIIFESTETQAAGHRRPILMWQVSSGGSPDRKTWKK